MPGHVESTRIPGKGIFNPAFGKIWNMGTWPLKLHDSEISCDALILLHEQCANDHTYPRTTLQRSLLVQDAVERDQKAACSSTLNALLQRNPRGDPEPVRCAVLFLRDSADRSVALEAVYIGMLPSPGSKACANAIAVKKRY